METNVLLKLPFKTYVKLNSDGLCTTSACRLIPLEDQKEVWLLRSGLINIRELGPGTVNKFEFFSHNLPLNNIQNLAEGDVVEIRMKKLEILNSAKMTQDEINTNFQELLAKEKCLNQSENE